MCNILTPMNQFSINIVIIQERYLPQILVHDILSSYSIMMKVQLLIREQSDIIIGGQSCFGKFF